MTTIIAIKRKDYVSHHKILLIMLSIMVVTSFAPSATKTVVDVVQNATTNTTDMNANRRAILAVIRFAEGTADQKGYYRIFGGSHVQSLNDHPRRCIAFRNTCSTAAGAYQILDKTYKSLGMTDFSIASQDRAAIQLIKRRGALALVDQGNFKEAIAKLSPEWASLPRHEGDRQGSYKQPVKSMQELEQVYIKNGGKISN